MSRWFNLEPILWPSFEIWSVWLRALCVVDWMQEFSGLLPWMWAWRIAGGNTWPDVCCYSAIVCACVGKRGNHRFDTPSYKFGCLASRTISAWRKALFTVVWWSNSFPQQKTWSWFRFTYRVRHSNWRTSHIVIHQFLDDESILWDAISRCSGTFAQCMKTDHSWHLWLRSPDL